MLKKQFTLLALLLSFFAISGCDNKLEAPAAKAADTVQVLQAKIRALPPSQKVTALYLQIKNDSASTYRLVSAESDISQFVEIHQHTNVDGVMKMEKVPFVDITAKSTVEFKPGGYHIMLINLKKELKLGDSADVTLVFKDGSKLIIQPKVQQIDVD